MRFLLLAALAACALDNQLPDGGSKLSFNIDGIPFQVASGAARVGTSTLGLYLSDQPDACLAILQIPVGRATLLTLLVPSGAGTATLGPSQGDLTVTTGSTTNASVSVASGSVSWTANTNGTYTIVNLDVGFSGTTDRLQASGLTVPTCAQ